MSEQNFPTVDKQMLIAGTPFKVLTKEPKEFWSTNYAYYLAQKQKGVQKPRPILGRYVEGNFQIYNVETKSWEDANFWDHTEPMLDAAGQVMLNKKGEPRKRPYFENKKIYLLEFKEPVNVSYWDKEVSQVVTKPLTTFYVKVSKSVSEKIQSQLTDPRNAEDTYYILNYDNTKSPAEQYEVKYHSN